MKAFRFGRGIHQNYITTAQSEHPFLDEEIDLKDGFHLSVIFRPDSADTNDEKVLIAGIPGRFGIYQKNRHLFCKLAGGTPEWNQMAGGLDHRAWHPL